MGERISFAAYNRATMGYDPTPVPDATLEGWRQELEEGLGALGVRWSVDGREAWRERVGVDYTPALGQALRDHARAFAARVQALVPGLPDPEYTIRVVEEDAYWSNWIDGSADQGITLQINTHPRIEYKVDSALSLAAHEIGGHAMHVAALRRGVAQGTVDPAALCLTVHACEAFQMEGLAQVVLDLLGTADETGGLHPLQSLLRTWSAALSNNAQLRLEAGEPVHDVLHDLVAAYPLANPMSLESGLRDRARSPLLRSYIPVYGPSRALFLRAVALPDARRAAFFRDAYTGLWTPDQLEAKLTA